jgi:hypothetical protein
MSTRADAGRVFAGSFMYSKSMVATLAALALFFVPAAEAQQLQTNPQILDIQTGCFLRNGQASNVQVKVGPYTTGYHFIFKNAATQQVVLDRTIGMINPTYDQVPFNLPAAGTYRLTLQYAAGISNQTPTTSPTDIVVKQVSAVTTNGQTACRETMQAPSGQQPTRR